MLVFIILCHNQFQNAHQLGQEVRRWVYFYPRVGNHLRFRSLSISNGRLLYDSRLISSFARFESAKILLCIVLVFIFCAIQYCVLDPARGCLCIHKSEDYRFVLHIMYIYFYCFNSLSLTQIVLLKNI